jgi:hypothetical protein
MGNPIMDTIMKSTDTATLMGNPIMDIIMKRHTAMRMEEIGPASVR